MSLISPDVGTRLKPDAIVAVTKIYRELCNLQPDTNVLVLTDARTSWRLFKELLRRWEPMLSGSSAKCMREVPRTSRPRSGHLWW
jgi:hypothetical protein